MLSVSNHISVEAGIVFLRASPVSWTPKRKFQRRFSRRGARASSSEASSEERRYSGPKPSRDFVADWVTNNDDLVRSLPIYVGGFSLLAVLFNRAVSGIAPVADASRYGRKFNFSLSLSLSRTKHSVNAISFFQLAFQSYLKAQLSLFLSLRNSSLLDRHYRLTLKALSLSLYISLTLRV